MDTESSGNLSFEHRGGSPPGWSSSGNFIRISSEEIPRMTVSLESICKSQSGVNSFFSGDWDSLGTLAQNAENITSPMDSCDQIDSSSYARGILENQGISSSCPFIRYSSDPNFVKLVPNIPHFSNGSFLEMDNSLYLPGYCQIGNSDGPPHQPLVEGDGTKGTLTSRNGVDNCAQFGEKHEISDKGIKEISPNGKKRKRVSDDQSQLVQLKNMETVQQNKKHPKYEDEIKQKTKQNPVANLDGRVLCEEVKDCSQNEEAQKEDYIHVRAKRGHATNSHSLAERMRRERISERMKFLQDLVPGCNKITGKAVMLDEIINYVQSLQRQVEFLSMKIATVYPEMNADLERILSKDIHHSEGDNAAIPRFAFGMNSSYPIQEVILKGDLPRIQNLQSPLVPLMPNIREDELQSINQMSFISNSAPGHVEPNGCMQVEQ